MTPPRTAILRGREHVLVGVRGVVAEGPAAIAISRGGAAKTYEYTDANEDAVAFAIGAGGVLIAVADGHYGCYGAECAMESLLSDWAPSWTDAATPHRDTQAWMTAGLEALVALNNGIIEDAERRNLPPAPTTFSLMLARPEDDLLLQASAGDSHAFRVDPGGARDLGWGAAHPKRCHFLGAYPETSLNFSDKCSVSCEPLAATRALVAVTDGLSERGIGVAHPDRAVAESVADAQTRAAEGRALHCTKSVLFRAFEAQRQQGAGDNIAIATVWLADGGGSDSGGPNGSEAANAA